MDSKVHSKWTKSKSEISKKIKGKFSIFGGAFTGSNIELKENEKIVQLWRGESDAWPKDYYSTLTVIFEPVKEGTLIKLTHEGVPQEAVNDVDNGWHEHYWKPLKEFLEK